jgi:hypothetical protein
VHFQAVGLFCTSMTDHGLVAQEQNPTFCLTCVKGNLMDAIGLKYDWWRKCKDIEYWKTSIELLLKCT